MGYTYGTRWNDDLIKSSILEVKEALGIDRMPSRRECQEHFHNTALATAVSRRNGWYSLAKEMGLPVKKSETEFGKHYESTAANIIDRRGHLVERMPQNFPYDLLVDGGVKVDVKASRLYRGPDGNFFSFSMGKPYATCDVYILFCVDDESADPTIYIVPSAVVVVNKQISIGSLSSKYDQYRERWDLLEKASLFFGSFR